MSRLLLLLSLRWEEGPEPRRQTVPGHEEEMLLRLLLLLLLLLPPPGLWGGSLAKDLRYRLEPKESVTVQESLCVSVPCKFSWSGSSNLHFVKQEKTTKDALLVATDDPKKEKELQEGIQGRFLILRDPKSKNCSLTIRDVNMGDSGTYFNVKYRYYGKKYEESFFTLKVTALTNKPEILIPGPLESGRPKQLNCYVPWACERGTPPIFSWTSAAHSSLGLRSHPLSSMLTLTPRPRDHGANLTCQVHFPATGATVERTIRLHVTYAPHDMAISIFQGNGTALKILQTTSLPIPEGQTLRLLCVADSNPPAELSWFWGSPGLNATPVSTTGILELPRVRPAQEGEFTCQAQHRLGSQTVSLRLSVVYPPRLLGPSCSWGDRGLHCSCSARAWPAPSLRWRLGAGVMEGNHGNASHAVTSHSAGPWTNSSLSLLPAGLSPDLRLSCEARNAHGAQSASVLLLPGAEDQELTAAAQGFSKGAALGAGVSALLCLGLGLAIAKTVRKTKTRAPGEEAEAAETPAETPQRTETWRSRLTRRSTILDYINVVPKARGPARDPKAMPGSPPRAPPAGANSSPERKATPPAPEPRDSQQEIHYASLSFPRPRPPGAPEATDTNSEYAEIRFH